jgi:hypothetical protein
LRFRNFMIEGHLKLQHGCNSQNDPKCRHHDCLFDIFLLIIRECYLIQSWCS